MSIDASALVALMTREPEAERLAERLEASSRRLTSPVVIFETALAFARKRACSLDDAQSAVSRFLALADVEVVPIGLRNVELAVFAFEQYGKGRHPAALNLGDCFAHACAKSRGAPWLYKGDDFSRTDAAG